MSTIVTRAGKGSPLTHTEVDNNFINLNTDKYQSGDNVSVGTLSATGVATFSAGTVSAPALTTTGDTNTGIFFPAADTIAFTEGGVEAMRIDSSGNVGIGTSSPSVRLDILSAGNPTIKLRGSDGAYTSILDMSAAAGGGSLIQATSSILRLATTGANQIQLETNGSERMRIDSSGNVGIGTTSPSAQLQLNKSGTGDYSTIRLSNSGASGRTYEIGLGGNTAAAGFANNLYFYDSTASATRMVITSAGDLLVGTTASSAKLTVLQGAGNAIGAFVTNQTWNYQSLGLHNTATSNDNLWVTFTSDASSFRGSIDYNRGSGVVRYNTTSDERLKENIVDSSSALPLINSVKIRAFNWKETGFHVEHGVIAQELKTIAPEAVSVGEDNEDGSIKRPWGVDTATLVPALIKAVQELNAKVEAQAAEIALLKSK